MAGNIPNNTLFGTGSLNLPVLGKSSAKKKFFLLSELNALFTVYANPFPEGGMDADDALSHRTTCHSLFSIPFTIVTILFLLPPGRHLDVRGRTHIYMCEYIYVYICVCAIHTHIHNKPSPPPLPPLRFVPWKTFVFAARLEPFLSSSTRAEITPTRATWTPLSTVGSLSLFSFPLRKYVPRAFHTTGDVNSRINGMNSAIRGQPTS